MTTQTVKIVSLAFGGDGVARLADGKTVFVPYSAPGDTLLISIKEDKKTFCRGEIIEIIEPSPARIEPMCRHFGRCGGCQYQHISYDEEFKSKQAQLLDCLKRIGGFKDISLALDFAFPAPECYGYRNKLRLEPGNAERDENNAPHLNYGYFLNDNKTFFTVRECLLADPKANKNIPKAMRSDWGRQNARRGKDAYPLTVRVTSDGTAAFYFGTAPKNISWLKESLCGRQFSVPLGSFWQVNRQVAEALITHVSKEICQWPDAENLIDAYSGVGTFSVCMEKDFAERVLIESDRQAAEAAQLNHADHSLGCRVIPETTEKGLPEALNQFPTDRTVVLLDPPRTGCEPSVINELRRRKPKYIVYVSCNPSTLARDLKTLCADNTYSIIHTGMADMFPRTAHFESLVCLTLNR